MRRGILASKEQLKSLGVKIARKPFCDIYAGLRQRCTKILESTPITEQQWQSAWKQGGWFSAVNAARTAQGRIIDLLIAHNIDPNTTYRTRAAEELRNLIAWNSWSDPCCGDSPVDLCTAEAAVAATIGLDWLWEEMTEPDRLRIAQAIRKKAIEPYAAAVKNGAWWYDCYHSWNAVVNSGCGLAALAMSDDEPASLNAFKLAKSGLKHFFDALGREGGWDEGTGYWGYAMRYVLLLAEAASRTAKDQSIYHSRGMDATGLFPVYFTPNGQPASFGDLPAVPLYGVFYLFANHFGLKETAWWLDTFAFHRDVGSGDWSNFGLALLFRQDESQVPSAPDLQTVKVFNEIGWAAMADHWPKPNFYVAAKAGDLSANHSQRDMNSIQVQIDGEMLLTDLGNGPMSREYLQADSRGNFYEVQARAHNTITIGNHDHRIDAQGDIVEALDGENFRWLACDAGNAIGTHVKFIRHIAMIVDPKTGLGTKLAVVDELSSAAAHELGIFWHSCGKIVADSGGNSGMICGNKASLYFALAASGDFKMHTESRDVGVGKVDNIIRAATVVSGKMFFVSAFTRRSVAGKVKIKYVNGALYVSVGQAELTFKSNKKSLILEKVAVK